MLRIGIIGCGEVAQIIHLPTFAQLSAQFRVVALCDVSRTVLDGVGARWGVARRFLDHRELLAQPDVDAVLIANPHAYHARVALEAMAAGKHVLIEKPMCLTLAQADDLIEAQARHGVVAQVGYMRRYAPAFIEALDLVRAMPDIRLARVHDVIGRNALIIRDTSAVIRGNDIPAALGAELSMLQDQGVTEAIGPADPNLITAYIMMLGLVSHDVSAMRELLGAPRGVLYAAQHAEGRMITAAFDYGTYVCQLEVGVDQIARFDAHLEVYGGTRTVRVEYETPYIRHLATRLVVTDAKSEVGLTIATGFPSRQDAFVAEWLAFHDNVTHGRAPKTSLQDSREDLRLFGAMARAMRQNGAAPSGAQTHNAIPAY
jgi:predicted dehydrogenase